MVVKSIQKSTEKRRMMMKKIFAFLLVFVMILSFAACNNVPADESTEGGTTAGETTGGENVKVLTYAEYDAIDITNGDVAVVIEAYVQATQGWWSKDGQGKITVYLQDPDGAYFVYELACSEEDAAKLTKGTKIKVTGYKGTWAGEIEIMDGKFEFGEGTWIAEATDVTALLGTDELIKHQNKFVSFKGLKIEKITYKNDAPGDDIYVDVSKDGNTYSFCVERYLTDPETDVYKAFADLKAGDVVDIEGFLYWYQGVNTHITGVSKVG